MKTNWLKSNWWDALPAIVMIGIPVGLPIWVSGVAGIVWLFLLANRYLVGK